MPPRKKAVAKNNAGKARATTAKKSSSTTKAKAVAAPVEPAQRSSRRKRGLSPDSAEPVKAVKKAKPTPKSSKKIENGEDGKVEKPSAKANGKVTAAAAPKSRPKVAQEPDFEGTFDIFSTSFDDGALMSIYLPLDTKGDDTPIEPDSLYAELKRRQAKDECTARIELHDEGLYRGRPVDEGAEFPNGCPGDYVVEAIDKIARWEITEDSKEMEICGGAFDLEEDGDTRPGPATEVTLSLGEEGCGIEDASGVLKMRRLWAREKKGDIEEVFEGYLKVGIYFNVLLKHRFYAGERKIGDGPDKPYVYSFWAIRSRKRADGTVIGPNDLKVGDGDESE
ncbi:unnamed protein product [Peniophora sp. CBMAI 1063]|nr:unnamed protein product [Peniophora sp. CBMAI 1063]